MLPSELWPRLILLQAAKTATNRGTLVAVLRGECHGGAAKGEGFAETSGASSGSRDSHEARVGAGLAVSYRASPVSIWRAVRVGSSKFAHRSTVSTVLSQSCLSQKIDVEPRGQDPQAQTTPRVAPMPGGVLRNGRRGTGCQSELRTGSGGRADGVQMSQAAGGLRGVRCVEMGCQDVSFGGPTAFHFRPLGSACAEHVRQAVASQMSLRGSQLPIPAARRFHAAESIATCGASHMHGELEDSPGGMCKLLLLWVLRSYSTPLPKISLPTRCAAVRIPIGRQARETALHTTCRALLRVNGQRRRAPANRLSSRCTCSRGLTAACQPAGTRWHPPLLVQPHMSSLFLPQQECGSRWWPQRWFGQPCRWGVSALLTREISSRPLLDVAAEALRHRSRARSPRALARRARPAAALRRCSVSCGRRRALEAAAQRTGAVGTVEAEVRAAALASAQGSQAPGEQPRTSRLGCAAAPAFGTDSLLEPSPSARNLASRRPASSLSTRYASSSPPFPHAATPPSSLPVRPSTDG